jgi:metal-sulfur cluster biosynthetic enzyme
MNVQRRVTIERVLETIVDPCSIASGVPISLIEMGLISEIEDRSGAMTITLRLTSPTCWQVGNIIGEIEQRVESLGLGPVRCIVDMSAAWTPDMMSAGAQAKLRMIRPMTRK